MNDPLNLISVPVITSLVFGAMSVFKQLVAGKEQLIRLIPSFAIILGAVLGCVAFYAANNTMPANDVLTAILIGGASGLAATGSHQIFKQLAKFEDEEEQDNEKEEK